MEKITAIVIAAGASVRMKATKQLLPFGNSTMLGKTLEQAIASDVREVILVLGANYQEIKTAVEEYKVGIIKNKKWENGLGTSISAGVEFVMTVKNPPEGIIILLGDQPLIDADFLNAMIKEFLRDPTKIVATGYSNSVGVPALFPQKYFKELKMLSGDTGARRLLNSSNTKVTVVKAGEKTVDVDTTADYHALLKKIR